MPLQPELTLLVRLAALLHATWNAVVKGAGGKLATCALSRAMEVLLGTVALALLPTMAGTAWPYVLAAAINRQRRRPSRSNR